MKDKLIVALDVDGLEKAEALVKTLSPSVGTFKIGKELFTSAGPDAIRMVHDNGARVFLDLKFHDIPNTVGSACEAAARLGVFMVNVHALGGGKMMVNALQAMHQYALDHRTTAPLLIGVTVLTSLTDRDLKEVGISKKLKDEVVKLALLCKECRLDGVVSSPQEIELIRQAVEPPFVIVTPGVRPTWAGRQDQKRVMTPKEAIEAGANYIVVGRPITKDPDPLMAANKILREMEEATGKN